MRKLLLPHFKDLFPQLEKRRSYQCWSKCYFLVSLSLSILANKTLKHLYNFRKQILSRKITFFKKKSWNYFMQNSAAEFSVFVQFASKKSYRMNVILSSTWSHSGPPCTRLHVQSTSSDSWQRQRRTCPWTASEVATSSGEPTSPDPRHCTSLRTLGRPDEPGTEEVSQSVDVSQEHRVLHLTRFWRYYFVGDLNRNYSRIVTKVDCVRKLLIRADLVLLVNDMHFLHGHLVADFLVFPAIIAWQGDINEINFFGLFALKELQKLDLGHTYRTKSVIQHLK